MTKLGRFITLLVVASWVGLVASLAWEAATR